MNFIEHYRSWLVLCAMGLAGMIVNIDFTIVNTVLPIIQKDLSATIGQLQWMMAAFGICFATLLAISGRIADLYGRRLILYISMTGFLLASIGAGLSTSPWQLISCRFLQGLFGAPIFPCGIALIANAFPEKNRGKALGIFTGVVGIGLAIGPVLGGLIVSYLHWSYIFFINIPVILLSFLISLFSVQESKKPVKEGIDWFALVLFVVGFGLIVFSITEAPNYGWLSLKTIGSFLLGVLLLIIFLFKENQAKIPLLPLHIFKNKSFLIGIGVCIGGIAPLWALFFLAPLYLQNVLNFSPKGAGLLLITLTAMTVIAPPITGILLDRKGPKYVVISLFAFVWLSLFLELFFQTSGPLWLIILSFILFGIGWGMGNSSGVALSVSHLPSGEDAGVSSGAAITILNVAGVLLLSIIGTIFRHFESVNLYHYLEKTGINLTAHDEHLIRSSLSDPSKISSLLSPEMSERIMGHFKQSFMAGYHIAFLALLIYVLILFLGTSSLLFSQSNKK